MNKTIIKKINAFIIFLFLVIIIFVPAINSQFKHNFNRTPIKNLNLKIIDEETIFSTERASWWDYNWMYRKKITINHNLVDGDLTNFPVLINIIDSDLQDNAQDDGDDIVFTKWDSQIKFNHEFEYFNGNTGELIAWVNVTQVNGSSNTDFYMYYGNPNCSNQQNIIGTWDSGFLAVHHLHQSNLDNLKDSTINNNDGQSENGNPNYLVLGKIGNCIEFDGIDDYIYLPQIFSGTDRVLTLEYWAFCNEGSDSTPLAQYSSSYNGIYIGYHHDNLYPYWNVWLDNDPQGYSTVGGFPPDHWHYIAFSQPNSGSNSFYINGVYQTGEEVMTPDWSDNEPMEIGGWDGANQLMTGEVDEIRISNVARSSDWILTCYNTMNEPNNFLTLGSEEIKPSGDETPPISTHIFIPETPNGENGWYVSDVFILFNVEDTQSDLAWTKYSLDNGSTWITHEGPWPFGLDVGEGKYQLIYYSADVVGNIEYPNGPFYLKIDKTLPEKRFYSFSLIIGPLLIAIINLGIVKDDLSGLDRVDFYVNVTFHHKIDLTSWPIGIGRIIFWFYFEPRINEYCTGFVYDKAGNNQEL